MSGEARLEEAGSGLAPASDGWFVVNAADAAWLENEAFGNRCVLAADARVLRDRPDLEPRPFPQLGITLAVVKPGSHCPPGTAHCFVGAGEDCVVLMVGARPEGKTLHYPREETALRHGAGVETATSSPHEAYAPFPHWRPGRPAPPWPAPHE